MRVRHRHTTCAALLLGVAALSGCIERRIYIASDPPGALVHLNDVEVGRTPVEVDFLYFGVYDIRLEKEGYQPLWTKREAKPPLYEQPPFDLIAEALPTTLRSGFHWSFTLKPIVIDPDAVAARARAVRDELGAARAPAASQPVGEPRPVGEGQPLPEPEKTPVRERSGVPEPPGGKPPSEPPV